MNKDTLKKELLKKVNDKNIIKKAVELSCQDMKKIILKKEENELLTTTSNQTTNVLRVKNIQEVLKMLSKRKRQPIVTQLRSKYPIWKLLAKPQTLQYVMSGGFPCYEDHNMPSNILRIVYSDGTYKDIDFTIKPNFK